VVAICGRLRRKKDFFFQGPVGVPVPVCPVSTKGTIGADGVPASVRDRVRLYQILGQGGGIGRRARLRIHGNSLVRKRLEKQHATPCYKKYQYAQLLMATWCQQCGLHAKSPEKGKCVGNVRELSSKAACQSRMKKHALLSPPGPGARPPAKAGATAGVGPQVLEINPMGRKATGAPSCARLRREQNLM